VADVHALSGFVLDHRAEFFQTFILTPEDVVVPVAIGGFWLAYFFHNLGALPLLPAYDPSAGEVLEPAHHHQTHEQRKLIP